MREVLDYYMPKILASDVMTRMGLESVRYFIVSAHREENVDAPDNLIDLLVTLNALAENYDVPVIVSTHPRTQKRLGVQNLGNLDKRIQFLKPFESVRQQNHRKVQLHLVFLGFV